jgi:hypothetical protein
MHYAATALGLLSASALLGPAVLATGSTHPRLATAYVAVGLLGGIVLYVVGFFYKIVPLLSWTVRFRGRLGKAPVPTIAELYSGHVAYVQLGIMSAGVVLLAAGIGAASPHVARCGTVLFLGGVLIFAMQIARVAFGGRS